MAKQAGQKSSARTSEPAAKDRPDERSNVPAGQEMPSKRPRLTPAESKEQKGMPGPLSAMSILQTESKAEQDKLFADISADVQPQDVFERMFVSEIAASSWKISRYDRVATALWNRELRRALKLVLCDLLLPPTELALLALPSKFYLAPGKLAYSYWFDRNTKRRVLGMLREAGLDESAIEAKAYSNIADHLRMLEKLRSDEEDRRYKAFCRLYKNRPNFADKLRRSSDRAIAAGLNDGVPPEVEI